MTINAENGTTIQVPRDLALLFKDNPGAQRAFNAFLNAIVSKVNGSSANLSEIEQRGGNPAISRVQELEKRVSELRPPSDGLIYVTPRPPTT